MQVCGTVSGIQHSVQSLEILVLKLKQNLNCYLHPIAKAGYLGTLFQKY